MRLYKRIFLKGVFHSVLQLLFAVFFGLINGSLLEVMISYFCFFYFRTRFTKQSHAETAFLCTCFAIFDYFVRSLILPSKNITIIGTILAAFFINYASYVYKDWLDKKDLETVKSSNTKIKKNKDSKRQAIIDILGKDNLDEEKIEEFCVKIGCANLSETIYLVLNNTILDVSAILEIDRSTIFRRMDKFIERASKN